MSVSVSRWVSPIAIFVFVTGLCVMPWTDADADTTYGLEADNWVVQPTGQATASWELDAVVLTAPAGEAASIRLDSSTPVNGNFVIFVAFDLLDWQTTEQQQATIGIGVMATQPPGVPVSDLASIGRTLTGGTDVYYAAVLNKGQPEQTPANTATLGTGEFRILRYNGEISLAYTTEPQNGGRWQLVRTFETWAQQPMTIYLTATNQAEGKIEYATTRVRFRELKVGLIQSPSQPPPPQPQPPRPTPRPTEPTADEWVIYSNDLDWLKVGRKADYEAPMKSRDEIHGGNSDTLLTKVLHDAGYKTEDEALEALCSKLTRVIVKYSPLAPPKELVTALYGGKEYKIRVDRGIAANMVMYQAHQYDFSQEKVNFKHFGLTPRVGFSKQWIIHATGHGTTQGPVKDDKWMLFTGCPTEVPEGGGRFLLPDGWGGTFTYSCDKWEGPYRDNYGLAKAMRRLGIDELEVYPPAQAYSRKVVADEVPDDATDYGSAVLGVQPIVDSPDMREWVIYTVGDKHLHIGTRKEFETDVQAKDVLWFGTGANIVPKQELKLGGTSYSYGCAVDDLVRHLQNVEIAYHPLNQPRETVEADVGGKRYTIHLGRNPDVLVAGYRNYDVRAEINLLGEHGILAQKKFGKQWLVHATGHGTYSGPVKDDHWMMVSSEPKNGLCVIADGLGGTFTYSVDQVDGPFEDSVALAMALKNRGLKSIGLYGSQRGVSVDDVVNVKKPTPPATPRVVSISPTDGAAGTKFYITVITENTKPCHRFSFGPDITVTDETCLGKDPDSNGERWLATVDISPTAKVGNFYPATVYHPCSVSPVKSPPGPPLKVAESEGPPLIIVLDIDGTRQDVLYEALCNGDLPNLCRLVGKPVSPNAAAQTPYAAHTSADPLERIEFEKAIGLLNCTAVFPSFTFCAQASIFTGNPPGVTGITGNQFLDRNQLYQYDFTGNEWYAIAQWPGDVIQGYASGLANKTLRCDTVYDRLPPGSRYHIIYNMYYGKDPPAHYWHIGHTPGVSPLAEKANVAADYGLYFYEPTTPMFDRGMADIGKRVMEGWIAQSKSGGGAVTRKKPWVLTLYFAGVDHWAHKYGIETEHDYLRKVVDTKVGELMASLDSAGLLADTTFIITADHGLTNTKGGAQPGFPASTPKGFPLTQRYSHNYFRNAPGHPNLYRQCYANLGYTPHQLTAAAIVLSVNGGLAHVNVANGLAPSPNKDGSQWTSLPSESDVLYAATAIAKANRDGVTAPASELKEVEQRFVWQNAADQLPAPGGNGPDLVNSLDLILIRPPPAPGAQTWPEYEVFEIEGTPPLINAKRTPLGRYLWSAAGQSLLQRWGWRHPLAAELIERRIQQLNCARSGDILLIPRYPIYYFETGEMEGAEHGSLLASDLIVPFIVTKGIKSANNNPAERKRLREKVFKTIRRSFGDPVFPSNMDTARVITTMCNDWQARTGGGGGGGSAPATPGPSPGATPGTPPGPTPTGPSVPPTQPGGGTPPQVPGGQQPVTFKIPGTDVEISLPVAGGGQPTVSIPLPGDAGKVSIPIPGGGTTTPTTGTQPGLNIPLPGGAGTVNIPIPGTGGTPTPTTGSQPGANIKLPGGLGTLNVPIPGTGGTPTPTTGSQPGANIKLPGDAGTVNIPVQGTGGTPTPTTGSQPGANIKLPGGLGTLNIPIPGTGGSRQTTGTQAPQGGTQAQQPTTTAPAQPATTTPTQPPSAPATTTPTITGPSIANLRVSDELAATGEIGPSKAALGSTAPKIWVALDYSGLQQGQMIRLLWTIPGVPEAIPWQTTVQTPAGRVSSWLNVPAGERWADGSYRVDVLLGASQQPVAALPFTIGIAAPSTPALQTPATTPSPDSVVKQAVLCAGVDEHNAPQGVSNSFPAGTQKVGLYVKIEDAPANAEITVEWSRDGRLVRRRLMVVAGNKQFISYVYASQQQSMRAGNYVVEIKENGRLVTRLPFTIQ